MATSGLLESDGELLTNGKEEKELESEKTDILPAGCICGLYNQQFVTNGTQCKIECYLPSTEEYIVIITSTNSRMIVNCSDVQKMEDVQDTYGSASPTNEKRNDKNSSNEQDYIDMARRPQYAKTRKSIVLSVAIGIIVILIGLMMYIQTATGMRTGGIIIMSFGVLVIICGVLWARFHTPPPVYFDADDSSM